ncbi:hypothetical protein BC826DRAFT_1109973 [Russula brevipes]|nr:hypothetical protein BC826DRAFT_1109973 [Russula brevipes]
MSNNIQQIQSHLFILTGDNYQDWKPLMKVLLQCLALWPIVEGMQPCPVQAAAAPFIPDADLLQAQQEWDTANNRAQGYIAMYLSRDIAHDIAQIADPMSNDRWDHLKTAYDAIRVPQVFDLFKQYFFKYDAHKPMQQQINHLQTLNSKLVAQQCVIAPFLWGMMLLSQLPPAWQLAVSPNVLSGAITTINFQRTVDQIRIYHDSLQTKELLQPKGAQPYAAKITNIKCKGSTPSFQEQRAPQGSSSHLKKKTTRGVRGKDKGEAGGARGKEGCHPGDQLLAEAHEVEEVEGMIDIDVVEEAQDVEEEEGACAFGFDGSLSVVDNTHCSIDCTVVVMATELVGINEEGGIGLIHDPSSDDLLKELATALEKGNGPVCLGGAVVRAGRLGQDDHLDILPWVGAMGQAEVEEVDKD